MFSPTATLPVLKAAAEALSTSFVFCRPAARRVCPEDVKLCSPAGCLCNPARCLHILITLANCICSFIKLLNVHPKLSE